MKKKLIAIFACIAAVVILAVGIYWYCHPTYYKFNDRFILGSTADEIVGKYGEFTTVRKAVDGEIYCGIYKVRDNTPELIMSYDNSLWYEIYFKNGIAVEVRLQEGWYGG